MKYTFYFSPTAWKKVCESIFSAKVEKETPAFSVTDPFLKEVFVKYFDGAKIKYHLEEECEL